MKQDIQNNINSLEATPEIIYLQHEGDDTYGEQTWCEDKINDTDVKYVRADIVTTHEQQAVEKTKKECFYRHSGIEFCGFLEDIEVYLVIGHVSEEEARQAIHEYEKYECGLDDEELYSFPLKEVKVKEKIYGDYGEVEYNWSDKNKTGKKGWLGRI